MEDLATGVSWLERTDWYNIVSCDLSRMTTDPFWKHTEVCQPAINEQNLNWIDRS
ncbi:hypothetical protein COMA2_20411 [Candidatus Nitrospira nitrificans]|uniref:Uncharacterized protein n=1 Tax=Candidatus Nitrospira nitrificans TaxID=1742973 RepID=A0A0S4LFR4_9BACT|nr:hypothetical protein COMA2_20411 [Candidatus Nitrospira nitrificans]